MKPLLERLQDHRPLLADGAMGTMLIKHGLKPGECPERMNLDQPELLEQISAEYTKAGADIVLTNTFGGSPLRLSHYSLDDRTEEINRAAVKAARKGAGGQAYVAASCGPCGGMLQPLGELTEDQIYDSFTRQLAAVIEEGIDMICVETMTAINEASLAIKAAKDLSPATPVGATMTFDETARGFFTIMGVSVEQAANGLIEAGADIIGSNCGNGIENMIKIAAEFRKHTDQPLIIQSNAGLPQTVDGELVYAETPELMAEKCRELIDIGVSIIGGCCGTTPAHIAAMREVIPQARCQP